MKAIRAKNVADEQRVEMRSYVREQFKAAKSVGLLEIDVISNKIKKGKRQLQTFQHVQGFRMFQKQ